MCLPRKTRGTHKISLILDLDETLLHSSIVPLPTYDIVFPVHFNSVNYQVYVRKRPHMDYFMNKVSQWFEIIVFTASQRVYAETLLNILDPERRLIRCAPRTLCAPPRLSIRWRGRRGRRGRSAHPPPVSLPRILSSRALPPRTHAGTACTGTRASLCEATGTETT